MPRLNAVAPLSRRERQVMDLVVRLETATARDVERGLPDPPTYSAVRSILRILRQKKLIQKTTRGGRDWYSSIMPAKQARLKALQGVVRAFFANSAVEATCALLGDQRRKLTAAEIAKLKRLIDQGS